MASVYKKKRYKVTGLEDHIPATWLTRNYDEAVAYAKCLDNGEVYDQEFNRIVFPIKG